MQYFQENSAALKSWKSVIIVSLILCCAFYFVKIIEWEQEANTKHEEFLAEAEARFGYGKAIPTKEINAYNQQKEQVFKKIRHTIARNLPLQEANDLSKGSWLRKLGEGNDNELKQDHQRLCLLLIQRAVANMPRYQLIQKDLKPKFMLYQKKLITETQWQMMLSAQQDLGMELNFIRFEAEKLKEGWSKDDKVFQEAAQVTAQLRKRAAGRDAFRTGNMPSRQTSSTGSEVEVTAA